MPNNKPSRETQQGDSEEALHELVRLKHAHVRLELLYDTIRDVTSTLSVHEVLERLLRRALGSLDAEMGSILIRGADELMRIEASQGLPAEIVEETSMKSGEGICGVVLATGEPLLIEDIEADPRFGWKNHERYYTHSLISAPLLHTGRMQGVININNKRSREAFEVADLQFLEAMAGQASSALANAYSYEELLDRAQRDSLTGLVNHGHLQSILDVEFQRARRYDRLLSFFMLDVDHFKVFNDRMGHPEGDEALRQVARFLESNSRVHDVVARYGGEEFAVILPETGLEGGVCFAEKMRSSVGEASFGGDSAGLTISVGIALSNEVESARALVALADHRLYEAKNGGRDRVCSTGLPNAPGD